MVNANRNSSPTCPVPLLFHYAVLHPQNSKFHRFDIAFVHDKHHVGLMMKTLHPTKYPSCLIFLNDWLENPRSIGWFMMFMCMLICVQFAYTLNWWFPASWDYHRLNSYKLCWTNVVGVEKLFLCWWHFKDPAGSRAFDCWKNMPDDVAGRAATAMQHGESHAAVPGLVGWLLWLGIWVRFYRIYVTELGMIQHIQPSTNTELNNNYDIMGFLWDYFLDIMEWNGKHDLLGFFMGYNIQPTTSCRSVWNGLSWIWVLVNFPRQWEGYPPPFW